MVVRTDGEVSGSKVYRGENAVRTFLSDILQEEVKIRKSLASPMPIVMMAKDWEKFKNATDCHICNKSLIKDEFLDSLAVFTLNKPLQKVKNLFIWANFTKNVFTKHRKNNDGC